MLFLYNVFLVPDTHIIDGQKAPKPIPWQVHVRSGGFVCGGTILDKKTILTAAHCISSETISIIAGVTNLQDGSAQTSDTISIDIHPSYNRRTINNDIAILKLKTSLTFSDEVKPACLPDSNLSPSGISVASGWGLVGQFPNQQTTDLMVCSFSIVTIYCNHFHSWLYRV